MPLGGPGMLLVVMPTRLEILTFGSHGYQPALEHAISKHLPSGASIRLVTGPYFLATKLAAFESRGEGDYFVSHGMEDMVAVLDGRPEIVNEVKHADEVLRKHLAERLAVLRGDRDFLNAIPGHLPADAASQARLPLIMERIIAILGKQLILPE